ncbi:hypothetical protein N836_12110 [Leptolyngbya sp. Heron Island J]|uniref:hypothetical protein n=1 Tax=Leptolyngbya sp. Heron Island J TaxID=1385935 RepID=UPI0003B9C8B6|nr:hypothetical protein [Leptolyngbya sp. Heron Island J]ESA35442.1 hypothetical protein N836_12110 [Leptolyngbya sp. Heron Island J]
MTAKSFKSQQIKHFKFWLEEDLQDGMQYQYALFQRIQTSDYSQRKELYQHANQLAQKGADILVTYEDKDCHLWLNLKHKSLEMQL